MDFLQNASNDQIALIGCFGALLVCGGMMVLTGHFNKSARNDGSNRQDGTRRLSLPTNRKTAEMSNDSKREAA